MVNFQGGSPLLNRLQYTFSNQDIDSSVRKIGTFLSDAKVEQREALRIKLAFEEMLLEYQSEFGEEKSFGLRLFRQFSALRIEIVTEGKSFNPLDKGESEQVLINSLLAEMGMAPVWSYKNGRNHMVFIPKKKPVSQTCRMLIAILMAVVAGSLISILPENIGKPVSELLLTPLGEKFIGLISAVSGPFIFLSILGSICSMGNIETFGRVGRKTVSVIFVYLMLSGLVCTGICLLFYNVSPGTGGNSDYSQIIKLLFDIVPSNLFQPFITGNALQIMFISMILGIAMLILSAKVNAVFNLVGQLASVMSMVMGGLSALLPYVIFVIFTNMIITDKFGQLLDFWLMILLVFMMFIMFVLFMLVWIAVRKKVSVILLARKILPVFLICLTTASSAAAFSTNLRDSHTKLGIDKRLAEFGLPLGQVMFKPSMFPFLCVMELGFAQMYGIQVTGIWVITGFITNFLLSIAVPPVTGGALMGYTIAFTQLGIPLEVMGIVVAMNVIFDFPGTTMNTTGWQLILVDLADSLDSLDKDVLRNPMELSLHCRRK